MAKRGRPTRAESRLKGTSTEPLPAVPQYAIGIDIGVEGFHLSFADANIDPKDWPVWFISYEDDPRWRDRLLALLGPDTICVAEPTGWHYLSPVARVITTQSPASLFLVQHSRSGSARGALDISQKTDTNDARALASIAFDLHYRARAYGAWRFSWIEHEQILELRFLVNAHYKAGADKVRFNNRIKHLGHSIDPALNFGTAWRKCRQVGAFTPDEILDLPLSVFTAGQTRTSVKKLQARLTRGTHVSPALLASLQEAHTAYEHACEREQILVNAIVTFIESSPWHGLYERFMSFPMANSVTCAALIVASKGQADTMDLKVFKATVGAFPQIKESGDKKGSRTAKRGYRPAMKGLHIWAQSLVSASAPDNPIKEYFKGGVKNGGRKFSATKAKLVRCLHGACKQLYGHNNALAPVDQLPETVHPEQSLVFVTTDSSPGNDDQQQQQQQPVRKRGRPRKAEQQQQQQQQPITLEQSAALYDGLNNGSIPYVVCETPNGSYVLSNALYMRATDLSPLEVWNGEQWLVCHSFIVGSVPLNQQQQQQQPLQTFDAYTVYRTHRSALAAGSIPHISCITDRGLLYANRADDLRWDSERGFPEVYDGRVWVPVLERSLVGWAEIERLHYLRPNGEVVRVGQRASWGDASPV